MLGLGDREDRPPRLVIFDLDGTLVDSAMDLTAALDRTLAEMGLPAAGVSRVRSWIGNGVRALVRRGLTDGDDERPVDGARLEDALARFERAYAAENGRRSRVYPGVRRTLETLAARRVTMACVTNKSAAFSEPLLERLGLMAYFSLVVSGDTTGTVKPDPGPLLHALRHHRVAPAEGLMVGDSVHDVAAARAAGMRVICVSYGYNHGQDIRAAGADAVVDDLSALLGPDGGACPGSA